ncbi:hypothetical protein [Marivirga sp.]|uniref:hypothetical protein n=1 Tax=Marivirga sp. TaxID=2018662 RepID=UPI002D7F5970|nr:hypothetical protein [Marivirga sp.]HET8860007.1 hypothetical protein [Marivirga sp.]
MNNCFSTKKTPSLVFYVLCFCLFTFSKKVFGQETEEDVSQYFDDAGIQEAKNILKVDMMSIINGDYQLLWEHRFAKKVSFELGLGNVSNKGFRGRFPEFITGIPAHDISYSRLSYAIALKFYPAGVPEYLFYSINYRKRPYLGADVYDFYLGSGYQFILKTRLTFAAGIGMGFRNIQANTDPAVVSSGFSTFFPLQLSIGYIL